VGIRWLAPLVLLAVAGCRPEPDDLLFVVGEVRDPIAGIPVPNAEVKLERNKSPLCASTGPQELPSSAGADAGTFHEFATATTDGQGRYLFELMRFQVADTSGLPYCLRETFGSDGGASAETRFSAGLSDLQPPPLFSWSPDLSPSRTGGAIAVALPPLPEVPTPSPAPALFPDGGTLHAYQWEVAGPSGPLWREEAEGDLRLPAEVLEDFPEPTAVLKLATMELQPVGPEIGGWVESYFRTQRSAPFPLGPGPAKPVSRGAACATNNGALDPCPLTDGDLALVSFLPPSGPGPGAPPPPMLPVTELRVILPAPAALRLAVIHGVFGSSNGPTPAYALVLEGSADCDAWAELGRQVVTPPFGGAGEVPPYATLFAADGAFAVLDLAPSGPVVEVRLRAEGGMLTGIRELSLFE